MNFPRRVPVLAKPQDGSSMRNVSSAAKTLSLAGASMRTSLGSGRLQSFRVAVMVFLGKFNRFAMRNENQCPRNGPIGPNAKTFAVHPGPKQEPKLRRANAVLDFALQNPGDTSKCREAICACNSTLLTAYRFWGSS